MPRADSPLKGRLIFAVGCRRSGTNWLQRILTARPDAVLMPTETHLFSHVFAPMEERFQHTTPDLRKTAVTYMSRDGLLDALRTFADGVFLENLELTSPDAQYLVERTPWHVYHVRLIADVYPDAPIVHIIRDGRDVTRSLLSTSWGPDTMDAAAEEWRSSVTAGRTVGASLPQYVEVFYERLLSNPEVEIPALYERLGLELTDSMLERVLAESRGAFNVDPLFPQIGSGKWRTALSARDLRTFDRIAGELLEELGYTREAPPTASPAEAAGRLGARARTAARAAARPRKAAEKVVERMHARRLSERYDHIATMSQRFQAAVGPSAPEPVDVLLTRDARVRIVDGGVAWSGRGEDAVTRLKQFASEHQTRWAKPINAESYPGTDTFTVVGRYRGDDGQAWRRTLVLTFAEELIQSVALYTHAVVPDEPVASAAGSSARALNLGP